MQCYESEALRLQLYAEMRLLMPDTPFDPLIIDDVLDEFGVNGLADYRNLEPARRIELARRVNQLSPQVVTAYPHSWVA